MKGSAILASPKVSFFHLLQEKVTTLVLPRHTAAGTPKSVPPVPAACLDQIDITLLKFPDELSIVAAIPIRAATSSGLADKVPRAATAPDSFTVVDETASVKQSNVMEL
ncbi:hypothetical protein [Collimonas humicola]|uniref:hypothetical protein n=1 Tax=Collimonas humicola TaxID=2825886 RepID=UPI001B8C88B8|nr:hypothetical protein [Collimonas humicola]